VTQLIPRQKVPELRVNTIGGMPWTLADQKPQHFTMVVVYRGLHCPICKSYLNELKNNLGKFNEAGISVIAISSDDEDRAKKVHEDWDLGPLRLGYGMTIEQGREWGLFVSHGIGTTSIGVVEPDEFIEPGLFLVRPDQTLYASSVQTMPFARPSFSDILGALNFIIAKDYPARGEVE